MGYDNVWDLSDEELEAVKARLIEQKPLLRKYWTRAGELIELFQTGEINTGSFRGGGAVKALDARTGKVRTLVAVPEGVARDPDVRFDGRRVLVSIRRDGKDDYHLYEVGAAADGVVVDLLTPDGQRLRSGPSQSRTPFMYSSRPASSGMNAAPATE